MIEEYKYYGQPHGKHYLVLTDKYQWEEIEVNGQKALYIVIGGDSDAEEIANKLLGLYDSVGYR